MLQKYSPSLRTLLCITAVVSMLWPAKLASSMQPQEPASIHFHHLHLNSTDPAAAIKFYTSKFDCEAAEFMGQAAVKTQNSWLLFNKVKAAPPSELTSAIWHFGWGAEDMKATYQKQLDSGTKFFTPLTDISDIAGGNAQGRFFYAYVEAPDKALVELNTSSNQHFGHLHMFSEDPVATGEWYFKHFGIPRRGSSSPSREPRFYRNVQIGPSTSMMLDNVNIIIYPVQYTQKAYAPHWKSDQLKLVSTKGRVVDHIAFSAVNLEDTMERLAREGVRITEPIKTGAGGKFKHAFIEGPDAVRIELLEML
jgi:catechol 2,3-dioxygenase-like lactoylglutathione lyase family enzyme